MSAHDQFVLALRMKKARRLALLAATMKPFDR